MLDGNSLLVLVQYSLGYKLDLILLLVMVMYVLDVVLFSATGDRQLKIAGYDGTTTTTWISGDSSGLLTITGGEVIPGKKEGTNFTCQFINWSLNTGTLNNAERNTGVGIALL